MASPYKTTVSVAAPSRDLASLATVKDELGITNTASDTTLARLITEQSIAAASYCDRHFEQETLVDSFRLPCWDGLLMLSRWPVASISSIVEDGDALTSADYEFDAATGFIWRLDGSDNRRSWAAAKIVATHVSGYQLLAELPKDIERAVILMVKQAWFAKTRDPLVRTEDVPGVYSVGYWVGTVGESGAIPPDAASLLDPYRRISV